MSKLADYERLLCAVEAADRDAAQAQGRLDRVLEELHALGCTDLEAAARRLKKLDAQAAALERERDDKLSEIRRRWPQLFDGKE